MGKLLLVGCGKMGGAMLDGWLARGLAASDAIVAEPVDALRPNKPGFLGRNASAGSATITSETARPSASQPSSIAPPILPHPTSRSFPIINVL